MQYFRNTVVSIMRGWIGKSEFDNSHREIVDLYNTIEPHPFDYEVKYTDAWCAATLSAAFHKAGYDAIFPAECSCNRMVDKAKAMGIWQERDDYVPAPGDCVLYDWEDSGEGDNEGRPRHIGMVEKVENGVITTIEGNYSDCVKRREIPVNGRFIRGFVTPAFTGDGTMPEEKAKDRAEGKLPFHVRAIAGISGFFSAADRFIYTHPWLSVALCAAVMLLVTAFKYRFFPESNFKDAQFIVRRALSGDMSKLDPAYMLMVKLFGWVYALTGVTSLSTWGWILLVPGGAMALYLLYRVRPHNVAALFTACCFSVLLPFYVFTVGKDFLQFTVFFIIALLLLGLKKEWMKAAAAILLLIPVAVAFRSYYVLMIGFVVLFYVFALIYRRMLTFRMRAVCLMCTALAVVAALYAIRFVFPERAQELFTIRSVVNASYGRTSESDKVILDLLPLERSVPGFLANFLFAGLRMVLPLELLGDIGDIPFVAFQLAFTALFIVELVKSRRVQARTAVYSVALAFFFMSFVFEPDFASWFRHEAAAFPILWLAVGSDHKTMRGVNTEGNVYGV